MAGWKRIVVGVDGSDCSEAALRWAVEEAQEHGAEMEVVMAWHEPPPAIAPPYGSIPWGTETHAKDNAQKVLEQTMKNVLGDGPSNVGTQLTEGNPAQVLIDASRGSDLLVVGTRGHGGFAGLLLGSISNQVAAHAACPVVVVR